MTRLAAATACVLLALPALGCGSNEAPAAPAPTAQRTAAERGAELFADPELSPYPFNRFACATCHAIAADPSRALPGAPLAGAIDRPTFWAGAEIDLLRAVNQCLGWFMLQDEPWKGDEPEAQAIYAYLESLPKKPADVAPVPFTIVVEVDDVPATARTDGAAVYDRTCASCHGPAHSGEGRLVEFAAVLPEDVLAAHPLGEYTKLEQRLVVIEKIRHGRFLGYEGQMPPFSREALSDEEIAALLLFMGM